MKDLTILFLIAIVIMFSCTEIITDKPIDDDENGCDIIITPTIKNVNVGSSNYTQEFENPIVYNSKLYFGGSNGLGTVMHEFDGTEISEIPAGLSDYQSGFGSAIIDENNNLYFSGRDGSNYKVYKFNTTISNVSTGSSDYQEGFSDPIFSNHKIYFIAKGTTISPNILYFVDDTGIQNIDLGTSDYYSTDLHSYEIVYDDFLYFESRDTTGDTKIYSFTTLNQIRNIDVGTSDYLKAFSYPIEFNSELYFGGISTDSDYKLYKYSCSSCYIHNTPITGSLSESIVYNSELYFTDTTLQKFDGTTQSIVSAGTSDYSHALINPIVYNSKLYFGADNGPIYKIYECNGSTISNVSTGSSDYVQAFTNPIVYNSKLYFEGNNGSIEKIYEFDGTEIKNVDIDISDYDNAFNDPIIYDNKLYFEGHTGSIKKIYVYY